MTTVSTTTAQNPLAPDLLERMDAWWRAANYLSVGQIYLYDNPLLLVYRISPRCSGIGAPCLD
jgi:xylulose-5-phosphate/fructose-6-phosphate phosphoketolase